MKLFARYTLVSLATNVLIFIVASIAFYVSMRFVLVHQIDEDLEIEEGEIRAYVQKHDRLPDSFSGSDQSIRFSPVTEKRNRSVSTVSMIAADDHKPEDYRRLSFDIAAAGQSYRAEVLKSLKGTNHLLRSIRKISALTILAILAFSALLNRYLLKRLWTPSYASLQAIKNFRVSRSEGLSLPATHTEEFTFMNRTLEQLMQSSSKEYLALKTFSENASHEIQTPIAIIRSKLDLLLQESALSENGSKSLQAAFGALAKLSRLNKSLLLLAKIENNQFEEVEAVDLKKRLADKLEDFSELWQSKNIVVKARLQNPAVRMNKELSDVLLNNLLANATVHNQLNETIEVSLTVAELSVKNSSPNPPLGTNLIFQRFYKPATSGGHNGLGLSILKQICDASRFELLYAYEDGLDQFKVRF